MRQRFIVAAAALLLATLPSLAELKVKQPCSDGMVLQQNTQATLWGHADAGASVTVCPSWTKTKYKVSASDQGVWQVKVSTPAASYTNYSVKVSCGKESITINDVLIGEVWFAGGQSNMQMPVRGFWNCPTEGYMDVLCQGPAHDKVRMYTEPTAATYTVESDGKGHWAKADCETVSNMSATAYFFATMMNKMLDVPVGIVAAPYGGTRVESWLPEATVASYGTENLSREAIEAMQGWTRPFMMYNAMICPLKGYTVKGFIWYQGCSNVGKHEQFTPRMVELIRQWREDFGDKGSKLPFYMCEIAPYMYDENNPEGTAGALLRKAQHDVADIVDNCECIVTNDLVYPYETRNIHPCQKKPVGERLAQMALNRDYGFSDIYCKYPKATKVFVEPSAPGMLYIEVENCPEGIGRMELIEALDIRKGSCSAWSKVKNIQFEVDKKRVCIELGKVEGLPEASAVSEASTVSGASTGSGASKVCDGAQWEVRYGWADFRPGNLFNNQGLPFTPFYLTQE